MALIQSSDKQFIYLSEHHTFGRLAEKVDTLVEDSFVSRIHAVIQWKEPHWEIRDLSSNGTWVNGEKIPLNQKVVLQDEDAIQFGHNEAIVYVIKDTASPQNALVQQSNIDKGKPEIIHLSRYHFLPNEDNPDVVLYKKANLWYADNLHDTEGFSQPLNKNAFLNFADNIWQLRIINDSNATLQLDNDGVPDKGAMIKFYLSLDEEHCTVEISTPGKKYNLASHSHHLLTLMLARYRAEDRKRNLPVEEQGWVYLEQLSKDIGLEERHINIQVHRVRKQLADTITANIHITDLIERRRGQLRFASPQFQIHKGGDLEYSSVDDKIRPKNH